MSLTWNIEKVKDYDTVCWIEGELNPITNTLIWATMSVKLGEITEKNAAEFYARLAITEKITGPSVVKDGEPYYITPEDVEAHIGLYCNVINESRTKFLN